MHNPALIHTCVDKEPGGKVHKTDPPISTAAC